ncbi:hypothetical protein F383_16751 [Gossypium arboreum]|uniref:Uncharacterized protein n=1 Tax=Gossypium arboreum TaxID=29729 RepID=A0A0B0NBJ6_GOSAR|nr:hypothetical protein F383_16751 [Gossypium arboreum]
MCKTLSRTVASICDYM